MSWAACGGRNRKKNKNFGKIDLYALKEKYRFTENELLEFKQRFSYLSNAQELLVKEVFRENMGLLGLDTGAFLADRIFAALDVDNDGSIKLEEYLRYFDILIYGSPEEKYELTFRMIDLDSKGWFNYDEFEDMIRSMLLTWNNLTGSQFNIDNNKKLGTFLQGVFRRFDIDNDNQVTLENFKRVVAKDPQLLEIFDYFNQGIVDSIQPNAELDQKDLVIIDELEHLHNKLNELKEYLGGKNEQLEPARTSTKLPKTGDFNHLRPEHTSPRSELKTPIVSSLDSKIRRTIFFEAFKEEHDGRSGFKAARLHSDKANRGAPFHNSNPEQLDFARRFSYQQAAVAKNSEGGNIYNHLEGEGTLLERFKSVDHVSRPDYASLNVFTSFQDATFNKSDNILEFRKKKEQEEGRGQIIVRTDDQPGGYLYQETPRLKHEFKKDSQGRIDFGMDEAADKHNPYESAPVSAKSLKSHKEVEFSADMVSPGLKKPTLKITSVPLQPKNLDPDLENPYLESVILPPLKQSQKNPNLLESIIVTRPNCSINNGVPEMDRLGVYSPSETIRSAQQPNAFQLQQVSEQLDTLAAETLKIIEEIRNKKKISNLTPQQTAEMEVGQMKATAQNIHKVSHKDRKEGNFVSFGHQNWNLVLNMMLGIQTAVKSAIQKPDNFTTKDFNAKHIFELVPKRTSETKSSYKICTFFDYAPSVFFDLRKLYGIRNEDYLRSIGPEHMLGNLIKGNLSSLSELTSTGKSGSFFYYSSDGKYTLKTISRDEYHFLRLILQNYYTHLVNNPQSLMIKFFGLHKIRFMKKNRSKEKVYFIIMANVFHTFKEIHERYDLKGSTKGRITNNEEDPSVAKKDLNIILNKEKIHLPEDIADTFIEIIEKDSKFFEQNNIIDYSLLMGIHKLSPEEINYRAGITQKRTSLHESRIHSREGILSTDGTKLYFFGIIDILTEFNTKKKAEYVVKRVAYGKGISAVPPHQYADRFRTFIKSLIEKGKWRE